MNKTRQLCACLALLCSIVTAEAAPFAAEFDPKTLSSTNGRRLTETTNALFSGAERVSELGGTSRMDGSLQAGQSYVYQVRFILPSGSSYYSEIARATMAQ